VRTVSAELSAVFAVASSTVNLAVAKVVGSATIATIATVATVRTTTGSGSSAVVAFLFLALALSFEVFEA